MFIVKSKNVIVRYILFISSVCLGRATLRWRNRLILLMCKLLRHFLNPQPADTLVKRRMVISFAKLVALLVLFSTGLSACAEFKEAGRTIGHTTRNVTREIGHGTRDAAKEIGHGTKRVINSIGQETNDAEKPLSDDEQ
ncbi:MAG: hypothetical protein Q7T40_09535 [Methylobacter sp.]|nr:hypothetical protein [Methylobacter sp.]